MTSEASKKPGRPKTSELTREEQVRRNVREYRKRLRMSQWQEVGLLLPEGVVHEIGKMAEKRKINRQDVIREFLFRGMREAWEKENPKTGGKTFDGWLKRKLKKK